MPFEVRSYNPLLFTVQHLVAHWVLQSKKTESFGQVLWERWVSRILFTWKNENQTLESITSHWCYFVLSELLSYEMHYKITHIELFSLPYCFPYELFCTEFYKELEGVTELEWKSNGSFFCLVHNKERNCIAHAILLTFQSLDRPWLC